jgi:dTDP-4-amino-4,6-dideoxygalactose transaminase
VIRLVEPYITFEEIAGDFRDIFESGTFTRGPNVEGFSRDIATYTGARHVFTLTSATTALWTCLKLLGISPGDEVVISDFSFPASANVVEDLGASSVLADVSLETFNMLPEELERKITKKTKAVIYVDALGNPSGLHQIKEICWQHRIPLIEDAACAIGSSEDGERCGSIADLTCFSFHPRKLVNTGEGGAITTHDDQWAEWLRIKLAHGASGPSGPGLDFVDYGYNFRLSELQAAMGRRQLAKLDAIIEHRNAVRLDYDVALRPLGFVPQVLGATVVHNVQSTVLRVPEGWDRNSLIAHLKEGGVEATLGTYALSSLSYFRARYADVQPNSHRLMQDTITLPCFDGVDVAQVISRIASFRT